METLKSWRISVDPLPFTTGSAVFMRGDVDGDGQLDLVVALAQERPFPCETGALVLYLARGDTFQLAQQVGLLEPSPIDPRISHIPCPGVLAVRDMIGDGRSQVVFTSTICGAHTCNVSVGVLRWEGHDLRPVMTEPLPTMADPELSLAAGVRGELEIVLHGGLIGSLGAGPQRERREVYRWNGSRFALAERTYDPSNYLYFKVIDANEALRARQYAHAISLYEQVISDPSLEVSGWHSDERAGLQSFSRFRLLVAYALSGDRNAAGKALQDMSAEQPERDFHAAARAFWDAYLPAQSVAAGCLAVTRLAQQNPALAAVLSDYGYANSDFKPEDVCPFL